MIPDHSQGTVKDAVEFWAKHNEQNNQQVQIMVFRDPDDAFETGKAPGPGNVTKRVIRHHASTPPGSRPQNSGAQNLEWVGVIVEFDIHEH